jgi:hypothetical protein
MPVKIGASVTCLDQHGQYCARRDPAFMEIEMYRSLHTISHGNGI